MRTIKIFFIVCSMLITETVVFNVYAAATYNEAELAKLTNFLKQESAERGVKNYQQLGITSMDSINWGALPNVRWNNVTYYLQEVYWEDKKLSGNLDLSDFAGLRFLYCAYNNIKSVNLKNASILSHVDFFENELESIDITTNPRISWLRLGYNQLHTIDLSNNPELTYFCCTDNHLETLQIGQKDKLQTLFCVGNKLQTLVLENCTKLETVLCDFNILTSLTLNNLPELKSLSCTQNSIGEIQFPNCLSLESFICNNNELSCLDLSFHKKLTTLICKNNRLTSLNLEGCECLTSVDCDNNFIDKLDISASSVLTSLSCKFNNFSFLTLPYPSQQLSYYSYTPQNYVTIEGKYDEIDFSDIYNINDNISRFIWRYKNVSVMPLESMEGRFTFDEKYIGETFECLVQNAVLPKLTMQFNVTFLQDETTGNRNPGNDGLTVYASERTIHIVTGSPAFVSIYSLQGVLQTKRKVDAGYTHIPAERGVSVVVVDDKANYKVIVR